MSSINTKKNDTFKCLQSPPISCYTTPILKDETARIHNNRSASSIEYSVKHSDGRLIEELLNCKYLLQDFEVKTGGGLIVEVGVLMRHYSTGINTKFNVLTGRDIPVSVLAQVVR